MTLTEAREHYRLTPSRFDGLFVGRWKGSPAHWRVIATDDCGDTSPTGPVFRSELEAFVGLEDVALYWFGKGE